MKEKYLALIPARGGSKGLKNKNILEIAGKPLITHTVEAALKSKYITEVIVSTDSKKIAKVAVDAGAINPFMRPKELATDDAKVIDTFIYTVNRLKEEFGKEYENIIILQPTSPLRNEKHIDEAIELFNRKEALSVISVKASEIPLEWYVTVDDNLFMENYLKEDSSKNRQEYKKLYLPNGAIFIFNIKKLFTTMQYHNEKTYAYVMDDRSSIDIDNEVDFMIAEKVMLEEEKGGKIK